MFGIVYTEKENANRFLKEKRFLIVFRYKKYSPQHHHVFNYSDFF